MFLTNGAPSAHKVDVTFLKNYKLVAPNWLYETSYKYQYFFVLALLYLFRRVFTVM
jgi:hypothetical protein